jgi:hypothetical protein
MFLQLNPTISVQTPNGDGRAIIAFDYPQAGGLFWVVYLLDDGKIETYQSNDIVVETKQINETWMYSDVVDAMKRNHKQVDYPVD